MTGTAGDRTCELVRRVFWFQKIYLDSSLFDPLSELVFLFDSTVLGVLNVVNWLTSYSWSDWFAIANCILEQECRDRIKLAIYFQKTNQFKSIHVEWIGESIQITNRNAQLVCHHGTTVEMHSGPSDGFGNSYLRFNICILGKPALSGSFQFLLSTHFT